MLNFQKIRNNFLDELQESKNQNETMQAGLNFLNEVEKFLKENCPRASEAKRIKSPNPTPPFTKGEPQ